MTENIYDIRIKMDDGAFPPIRAHAEDAGLDLRAMEDQVIPSFSSACFDTGIHIELPRHTCGKIESKSGLNVKHGVVCCGGTIDCGYTGSIVVKLYNLSPVDYEVKAGDKLAQLIIMPCLTPELTLVHKLDDSERGDSGFGSSGR